MTSPELPGESADEDSPETNNPPPNRLRRVVTPLSKRVGLRCIKKLIRKKDILALGGPAHLMFNQQLLSFANECQTQSQVLERARETLRPGKDCRPLERYAAPSFSFRPTE